MADLLPQRLISAEYYRGDSLKQTHEVTNVIKWVQCFGVYTAIISQKEPQRTANFLGYQQLIIHSL